MLAAYAVADEATRGRAHPEPDRGLLRAAPFALDRHRIVNSTAFRRLEHKTQAFVAEGADHFRTRLTHSFEVAQIARWLARQLVVNVDLAEAAALAHDLGHSPFGHAGEAALNACMAEGGGFEHNAQSLRVVEYLEHPYPWFRGLNLTFETREALGRHVSPHDAPEVPAGRQPTIEAQIASLADRLAYDVHDLDDAVLAEVVGDDDLSTLRLWRRARQEIGLPAAAPPAVRRPTLDRIAAVLWASAVEQSRQRIRCAGVASPDEVRAQREPLVALDGAVEAALEELEAFLLAKVYRHERVAREDAAARRIIAELFDAYRADPSRLPERFARRIGAQGRDRVVCDYIAGMTDRFCRAEHGRWCGRAARGE